jgi:hypothetical protein
MSFLDFFFKRDEYKIRELKEKLKNASDEELKAIVNDKIGDFEVIKQAYFSIIGFTPNKKLLQTAAYQLLRERR